MTSTKWLIVILTLAPVLIPCYVAAIHEWWNDCKMQDLDTLMKERYGSKDDDLSK